MSILRVIDPGLSTTVQDGGRNGHMTSGVPVGGAADVLSLRIGNRLLAQPDECAALEITLVGGIYETTQPTTICLAGATATDVTIEGTSTSRAVPVWTPTPFAPGERLGIGPLVDGARVYLCIAGGIATPLVLDSRSTHAGSQLGVPGRTLQAGDELALSTPATDAHCHRLSAQTAAGIESHLARRTLRVLPLAHHEHFSAIADDQLFLRTFTISDLSDRTGTRLDGPKVPSPPKLEVSEPALPGVIQIPPAGRPIILGPDGPTTGGYPMPYAVITADLPALAQRRPRDPIRFERTTPERAREEALRVQTLLDAVASPEPS